jgi:hypothetical protein
VSWENISARFRRTADALRVGVTGEALDVEQVRRVVDAVESEAASRSGFQDDRAGIAGIQKRLDKGEVWPGELEDAAAVASALDLTAALAPATHASVVPRKRI